MVFEDNGKVFDAANNRSYGGNGDYVVYVTSSTGEKLKSVRHSDDYRNTFI